jgi:hypothetical protein
VKAFVLKYAAGVIVHEGLEYLERDARETLLVIDSLDPTAWRSIDDGVAIRFPEGRPARVLLLVHGTFSSTVGSYGGLASTPWGEQFIQAVKANYDSVLGFDHFTLKRDPAQNAQTLVSSLARIPWPKGTQVDIVAFSRGGLVVRCLMDQLTPSLKELLRFRRAIFVACTNEGTRLADPDRIRAFIDLYTNLATAACRLMGMLPQAKAVSVILKELTQGLASLVKYIAANALADGAVPGLAAMEPGGAFLQRLDRPRDTKSAFAESLNYVVTSEFVPRLAGDDVEPKELPARFLATIGEGFVRQLMNEGNDLVVNTSSMGTLPPIPEQLVHDRFDFGKTPKVYHTIYFLRPEVVGAITRWLELVKPEALAAPAPAKEVAAPVRRGGTRGPQPIPPTLPVAPEIVVDLPELQQLPAQVDPRFTIAPAHAPAQEVLESIKQSPSPYVVVRRFSGPETFHYGIPTDALVRVTEDALRTPEGAVRGMTLEEALDLHEGDASDERPASNPGAAAERPAVVLSGQHVVGVIPAAQGSSLDIVDMAKAALSPTDAASAAAAQRAMPPLRSAPAAMATLYMRGEMDDEVVVNQATTIDVTIAREVIGGYVSPGAREVSARAEVARKISVQAIPRSQFKILGEDRYEIDVPAPDKPWSGSFDVKATAVGDGEIWIVLSQDRATLASAILSPKVVENKGRQARTAARANAGEATPTAIDQLLIVEQRNGNEITLFFQLQSASLDVFDQYTSPPFKVEPRQYVKDLYHKIEERWVSSAQDAADFAVELKSLGADLLTDLFPDKLRAKLWEARDQLKKIMVISTEPFIPWELVHLKEPDKPLGDDMHFLAQKGVVRWLHQARWPPSQIRVRLGRVRHVVPDYPHPDYELHAVAAERQFMIDTFGSTEISPRPAAVRSALKDPQAFDLIHFACHGSAEADNIGDAKIMLQGRIEGPNYIPEFLDAVTVEHNANLRNPDGNRPMVFVNACQAGRAGYKLTGLGGFAQAFLGAGAGIFAGTLWSVGDEPASTFAQRLYEEMKAGTALADATVKAREAARAAGDASWLCYVVYGHPAAVMAMK